ncbi:phage terminase large subunit [Bacillus sp. CGMCC 1.16541]|uniref:phage terminase large subunit n=1 Tax=Bacillus sp. CGMCC 1.16541 TaxID=2185143 RepID=UPI0013A59B12|nr:phage terminase large subunit [Bacillus sp. CGMCC 1.16541]
MRESSLLSELVGSKNEQVVEEWEYALWDKYAIDHPDLIELKSKRPFTGSTGLRKLLGERSMEYFARAYFPEYIPTAPPSFHQEWFIDLKKVVEKNGGSSMVRAAPRGHAKTTIWDFVFPLWVTVYKKKFYILIISDAYDQAQGFISNIKDEIEDNERVVSDFGKLKGDRWQEGSIVCSNGVKIEALGAGMKVRGRKNKSRRPDLIILDDVENDENAATTEQRKKIKNWYKKAVRHAGARYTDFVFVGTVIHEDSLLGELLKSPGYDSKRYQAVVSFAEREDLWAEWKDIFTDMDNQNRETDARAFFEKNSKEMLKGAKVLWEENNPKFPDGYYSLMVTRVTDGESAFASELQNDPRSSEEQFFKPKYYQYGELPPLSQLELVMSVDPSMGQSDKSDFSAIIALATHRRTGQMYVLEADIKRRKPDLIIEAMFDIAIKFMRQGLKPKVIGIEDVQFQAFFKQEVEKRARARRLHLNIRPIRNTVSKDMRIESMEPSVNNGYILLHPSQTLLIEQLEGYPRAKKDGPDALEMTTRLATGAGMGVGSFDRVF